jgi:hypothetical protein
MKRLSFFSSAAAATLAPLALQGSADADSALTAPITQDEWKPFEEIAKAKGSKIEFNNVQKQGAMGEIHLDMNMVNASIANAAARAKAAGNMHLAAKFDRLAANGTAAQKSDFVLGTGNYYFPEDIAKGVSANSNKIGPCEIVCYAVCVCRSTPQTTVQQCRDICRRICGVG